MKTELETAIAGVVKSVFDVEVKVELTRPEEQFGDYATNVALQLSKKLGRNPREIGEQLAEKLRPEFADVSVAGPGFVNLRLKDEELVDFVNELPKKSADEFVIETNNPNPFKTMHIGHAFNAILADTVANLLEHKSQKVHRVSYHGDVGTHVGKSMYSLLRYINGDVSKLHDVPEDERNSFMLKMYAEGAQAYEENEENKALIDELSRQSFTLDDPVYKEVYETCKAWSFDQIDQLVARLGNKPVETRYLESQADPVGVETVKAHVPDVFQESNGALVFKGSDYGSFDNVFVNSEGRGLYAARDLGLMQLKNADYPNAKHSYILTAEEQRAYFIGVIKAAELCLPELSGATINIPTGTVKLSSGKMSSRSGDVLEVSWLFDQVEEAIKARGGESTAEVVAGALRYQFLKVRIGSDVIFDVEESVSIQGNSGPYLQYAHARARSILNKVGLKGSKLYAQELEAGERSLLRKLSEYPEVVEKATQELMPHQICTYIYELSQSFNSFYEHNRVIDDPRQDIRLGLVTAYAETLKSGLTLLGIASPDKM